MSTRNNISRVTIDMPIEKHKKLKALAALKGKSMREIVMEAIDIIDECLRSDHLPNKKTKQAIKNIEEGKNLVSVENIADFISKLDE